MKPAMRSGQIDGAITSTVPSDNNGSVHRGGCAKYHVAQDKLPAHSSAGHTVLSKYAGTARSAAPHVIDNGNSSVPASTVGTMATVNKGIATALTSGDTREKLPKFKSSNGSSPIVTAICTRLNSSSLPSRPARHDITNKITATAPKESHIPGASGAPGSSSNTASSARP